jgi:predicted histidine transporter YuiF (NhaC family)
MIRITSGLLIMFEGIFNLSISFPVAFSNIIMFQKFTSEFENTFGTSREILIASNVIPSLINLIQVLLGLYLVLHKKRNSEKENLD